jgi:hypothetical protein
MLIKKQSIKIFSSLFCLLCFFVPHASRALEFSNYDDLINYTEDVESDVVYYKYRTVEVPQQTDDKFNENLDAREPDKQFFIDPVSGQQKVKIYPGSNFVNIGSSWYQLEYATTTEILFFDELEKTVPVESLFEKMVSFYDFYNFALADSISTSSLPADGHVTSNPGSTWDIAHDATTGTAVNSSAATMWCRVMTTYLYRAYLPFFTDIGSGYQVDSASLFLMPYLISDLDETGSFVGVVENTMSDPYNLVVADFNDSGATDNPTVFSQVDLGVLSAESYYEFVLDSSGRSDIDLEGESLFAVRNGHDILDIAPSANEYSYFYTVEETGTSKDPYLEIYYSLTSTSSPSSSSTPVYSFSSLYYNQILASTTYYYDDQGNQIGAFTDIRLPFSNYYHIVLIMFFLFVVFWTARKIRPY